MKPSSICDVTPNGRLIVDSCGQKMVAGCAQDRLLDRSEAVGTAILPRAVLSPISMVAEPRIGTSIRTPSGVCNEASCRLHRLGQHRRPHMVEPLESGSQAFAWPVRAGPRRACRGRVADRARDRARIFKA